LTNEVEADFWSAHPELNHIGILKPDFRHPLPVAVRAVTAADVPEHIAPPLVQDLRVACGGQLILKGQGKGTVGVTPDCGWKRHQPDAFAFA
jgi:hypothetical protein